MKKNIEIYVDSVNNYLRKNNTIIGISSENLQGKIIFKPEPFVSGTCRMYIRSKGSILLEQNGEQYELLIKSALLQEKELEFCFKITESENENGIPVFCTKIIKMEVLETITDDSEIQEQYPTWIEIFDNKIAEINSLEENVNNKITEINILEKNLNQLEETLNQNETTRNKKVNQTIDNIKNLTEEYNKNAKEKTNTFNQNTITKTEEYNLNAKTKTEELEIIANGVKDTATAIQFATFELNNDMELIINTAEKLTNTSFSFNAKTGELEVEIVNG